MSDLQQVARGSLSVIAAACGITWGGFIMATSPGIEGAAGAFYAVAAVGCAWALFPTEGFQRGDAE